MENVSEMATARKNIDNAMRNLYMLRVNMPDQCKGWPDKIRRIECELFNLLGEIKSQETERTSSWWTKR